MRAEALELRMVSVSARALVQHGLCEERLSPERYKPLRVEMAGVE